MHKPDIVKWILLPVLVLFFVISYYFKTKNDDKITKDHEVLCGKILSIKKSKGGWLIEETKTAQAHLENI